MKKLRNFVYSHEQLLIILIAASLNLLYVFLHECWRDEAQAWLIALDNDIFSLFNVTSYEGHPCLWFLILMPFAKLGFPYFTLKLISFSIMLTVIIIIAVKAPFENIIKASFILCPMCIYCFVTPARNYCICALFVVLSALLYKNRDKNPLVYGIVLALALQTHIIMAGFVVSACVEWALSVLLRLYDQKKFTANIVLALAGMAIPFLSGLFLLFEFRDTVVAFNKFSLGIGMAVKNILYYLALLTFLALTGYIVLKCYVNKIEFSAPLFIFAGSILWQLWMNFFAHGLSNYRTITWLYFLLWFIWILYDTNEDMKSVKKTITIAVFLVCAPLWLGVPKIYSDLFLRYSGAGEAGAAIETLPEDAVIFESTEDFCNAVIPYIKTKTVYNPFSETKASYINRNPALRHYMNYDELIASINKMFPGKSSVYILVNCEKIPGTGYIEDIEEHLRAEDLYYSDEDKTILRPDEHFSIYRMHIGQGIPDQQCIYQ